MIWNTVHANFEFSDGKSSISVWFYYIHEKQRDISLTLALSENIAILMLASIALLYSMVTNK